MRVGWRQSVQRREFITLLAGAALIGPSTAIAQTPKVSKVYRLGTLTAGPPTFDTMNRERPDAILMVSDSLTLSNRRRVFEYAAERRLPAICSKRSSSGRRYRRRI